MYFDPKTNKYPYPLETDHHYLKVKKNDGTVFDKNYPYIDKSKRFKRKQWWLRLAINTIGYIIVKVRIGLKIKNRKNIKKYKDILNNGVISVSNHVQMMDYLGVLRGIHPYKPYFLSWAQNVSGENGKLVRLCGGIPIPENDFRATVTYVKAIEELLKEDKGWLHIYSEGSMWEYYAPIRPFKRGAAYFSCKYNKPIIPLGFSYRKPNWIRRKIFHQIATFTLSIGEPLYPNNELPIAERELDLTRRSHDEVCKLSGIDPKENIYEPIFNNSKRIDYYTNEYGVGYKRS